MNAKPALLLATALLAGCQLAPAYQRPDLPVAGRYPEASGPATRMAGTIPAADLGWRDLFADARLRAHIAAALEGNRDLAIAVARIEEARGLYRIESAARLPTLGASAEASRTRTSAATTGVEGAAAVTADRAAIGVGITGFELDFWGRVRNLSEAARARYLATVEAERAFRLLLVRDVASTYFALLEAEERAALAEATLESRREGLRIARMRLDAGVTSALDFRQAEALLTQAETELAALRLARARTANYLAVLRGSAQAAMPEEATAEAEPLSLARQLHGPAFAEGLPSDLLTNRPDIMAAEEQLRAARADIGAARAAFFPAISLTGNLGFASSDLDRLVGSDGFGWSFGPSISLPIFDSGRRRGALAAATARETIALQGYQASIEQAFREVADALAGRRLLAEQVAAQARATEAQRQIARLARIRYREGVANYLEVLDSERNLFAAEQGLLSLRRNQLDNLVSLYVALGGGLRESGATP